MQDSDGQRQILNREINRIVLKNITDNQKF